jgi:hypothetical protein
MMFCSTVNTHFGRSFHTLFLRVHSQWRQADTLGFQDVRSRTLRVSCILAVPSSLNHRYPPRRQVFLKERHFQQKFQFTEGPSWLQQPTFITTKIDVLFYLNKRVGPSISNQDGIQLEVGWCWALLVLHNLSSECRKVMASCRWADTQIRNK